MKSGSLRCTYIATSIFEPLVRNHWRSRFYFDGTPGRARNRHRFKVGCDVYERYSRDSFEFMLSRIFCTSYNGFGELEVSSYFEEAVRSRRKDTWRCYQTLANILINPRMLGHTGVVVWILPLDGGLASSLSRRLRQLLDAFWVEQGFEGRQLEVQRSLDIVFPVLCVAHVACNGLKNSTDFHMVPDIKNGCDNLWKGTESLRSAWEQLLTHVSAIFAGAIFDGPCNDNDDHIYKYWECLGLSSALCEFFTFINLRVEGGVMKFCDRARDVQ